MPGDKIRCPHKCACHPVSSRHLPDSTLPAKRPGKGLYTRSPGIPFRGGLCPDTTRTQKAAPGAAFDFTRCVSRQPLPGELLRLPEAERQQDKAQQHDQPVDEVVERAIQVQQAGANLRAAELNLRYTKVYAPVGGVIGRKTVEVGHRVQPGQTLLVIVPVNDIWVTANFKETQVRRMRPGLPVNVHVDASGRDYAATVQDMPAGVGTLFSLLPPENATGNFVKVVQRLPVRVRLNDGQDPEHQLRPGMSVEAKVSFE